MSSHVYLATSDFARASAFYTPLLALLGLRLKFYDPAVGWAGWQPADVERPLLIVGLPYDGRGAEPGSGQMTLLLAADGATVDRCFDIAMARGAVSEGGPGRRPRYHSDLYGAYFRDRDGNKLCVCCHAPGATRGPTK